MDPFTQVTQQYPEPNRGNRTLLSHTPTDYLKMATTPYPNLHLHLDYSVRDQNNNHHHDDHQDDGFHHYKQSSMMPPPQTTHLADQNFGKMEALQDFIHKNPQINYSFGPAMGRNHSGSSLGAASNDSGHSGSSSSSLDIVSTRTLSTSSIGVGEVTSTRSFSPHQVPNAPPPTPNLHFYGSTNTDTSIQMPFHHSRSNGQLPQIPQSNLHYQKDSYHGLGGLSPSSLRLNSIAEQIMKQSHRDTNHHYAPRAPLHNTRMGSEYSMRGPNLEVPKPPLSNRNYQEARYKTELCLHFREKNACPHGSRCLFAHGLGELRPYRGRHPKHKTQPCKSFHETGYCNYGYRCSYIHLESPRTIRYIKSLNDVAQQCRKSQKRTLVTAQRRPPPMNRY